MYKAYTLAAAAILTIRFDVAMAAEPIFVDQGSKWNAAARADFYTRDQGSRLIPLAWLQALKAPDGTRFLDGSFSKYGYLFNPDTPDGLPVGFHASGPSGSKVVGMTCAACHTRQIRVNGSLYRIDGGPALVDFQALLADLDKSIGQVLQNDAAFAAFASGVLHNQAPTASEVAAFRNEVDVWYLRYHTIISRSLPPTPWGLGRLDAVGMIFNRVTGLGVGQPPSYLIPENIRRADAPARYPFIWNATKQDKTQWPGFADNGSDILGLARNAGEVLGVFANFRPKRQGPIVNFLNYNSINFDGLGRLEELIKKIEAPKWPWPIDASLAAKGQAIFERPAANGGCSQCHGIRPGATRFPLIQTWNTPIQNVGTDTRQYDVLGWTANSGTLKGTFIPFATSELKETDLAFNILATAVIGSIAEHVLTLGGAQSDVRVGASNDSPSSNSIAPSELNSLPPALKDLPRAFNLPDAVRTAPEVRRNLGLELSPSAAVSAKGSYEARVLQGIWSAAPYLHNGSVATLADLLEPASRRKGKFSVGIDYDIENVGLASSQSQSAAYDRETTDCSDLNSGNSRCGHEYGTGLTKEEKKALLEYLKTL